MTTPATMSGMQLVGHGGPEMLVWNHAIPVPEPGPGEALVKVAAAGVNNTDINTRIGWYSKQVTGATDAVEDDIEAGGWSGALKFPLIQGGDLCGTVVAVGADAGPITQGMRVTCPINLPEPTTQNPVAFRVLGSELNGAFAEYCVVPATHLYDVSASPLSEIEIAAMPCAYGTAAGLIDRAAVGEGDRVIVTGASGGVGMAAVQLAALRGAHVTGVSGVAKADAVRAAGATKVIERGAVPAPASSNVVLDLVGGPGFGALLDALRPGGRYAVSGAIAGPIVEADLRTIYLNDLTLFGSTYQPRAVFVDLVELINAGRVRPLISKTYPLSQMAEAQADFMTKRFPGKLVLTL